MTCKVKCTKTPYHNYQDSNTTKVSCSEDFLLIGGNSTKNIFLPNFTILAGYFYKTTLTGAISFADYTNANAAANLTTGEPPNSIAQNEFYIYNYIGYATDSPVVIYASISSMISHYFERGGGQMVYYPFNTAFMPCDWANNNKATTGSYATLSGDGTQGQNVPVTNNNVTERYVKLVYIDLSYLYA